MELAAGRLGGLFLLFGEARPEEGATFDVEQMEKDIFDGHAPQSGVIQGLNNEAKLAMRKACVFRTFRAIKLALYHVLGKLPEPNLTHSFY